jgi:hypothetical protein
MKFVTPTIKIILLIFNLLPVILFISAFIILQSGETKKSLLLDIIFWPAAFSIPGTFILYVIDVYRNKTVKKEQKHLWAGLLFFGNIIVYPFYWYLHVWRKPPRQTEDEFGRSVGNSFTGSE